MSTNLLLGLQLMGYGLVGVFVVLGLFIVLISLLVKWCPYREKEDSQPK